MRQPAPAVGLFGQPESEAVEDTIEAVPVPQNVWLVQQERSREQRADRYVEGGFHSQKMPPRLARLMLRHLRLPAGATVLDPFIGTGTTAVEAHELGYRTVGCDIAETYLKDACTPNLERAAHRTGRQVDCDIRVGDARMMPWIPDSSIDGAVTSPPYGDCDPSRDSSNRSIAERAQEGEAYAQYAVRTSAYRFDPAALRVSGAMGSMTTGEWEASMFLALREIRRVLKNQAYLLVAVREFWRRKARQDMVDLPGRVVELSRAAGLKPLDIIYALDMRLDSDGEMTSRGSLHQNRLARKMDDGRPCPRGVPGVTRVLVIQKVARKQYTRRDEPEGSD